jgi:hypothetical protein
VIKEVLWDVLGGGDRERSAQLGAAAQEVLFRSAAGTPAAVLDTFLHRDWAHQLQALPGPVIEVHCACPTRVAQERYATRRRHPCHFDTDQLADAWERWVLEDAAPIALGPVLEVDTTHPVDIDAIAAWITVRRTG